MGMSASQGRFLSLTARKNNVEFHGQQINQQRTTLSNESASYYSELCNMEVPTPPSIDDYTKVSYTFNDGAMTNTIVSLIPDTTDEGRLANRYFVNYVEEWQDDYAIVPAASSLVECNDVENPTEWNVGNSYLRLIDPQTVTSISAEKYVKVTNNKIFRQPYADGSPVSDDSYFVLNSKQGVSKQKPKEKIYIENNIVPQEKDGKYFANINSTVHECFKEDVNGVTKYYYLDEVEHNTAPLGNFQKQYCIQDLDADGNPTVDSYIMLPKDDSGSNFEKYSFLKTWVEDPNNPAGGYYKLVEPLVLDLGDDKTYPRYLESGEADQAKLSLANGGGNASKPDETKFPYEASLTDDQLEALYKNEAYLLKMVQEKTGDDGAFFIRYVKNTTTGSYEPYLYAYSELKQTQKYNNKQLGSIPCYSLGSATQTKEVLHQEATIEKDASGRYVAITINLGTEADPIVRTYNLTTNTTTDEDAYNDAMNQYRYKQHEYDHKVQEINSKLEIIQQQDKQLELKLKQLDTEENAISTEMDAVKKVISKNVESSFKTFNA